MPITATVSPASETDATRARASRRGSTTADRYPGLRPYGTAPMFPADTPIHLFGLEMEGGWDEDVTRDGRNTPEGWTWHGDSSVETTGDYNGELVFSSPLPVTDLARPEEIIRAAYPRHVNQTCGGHVHVSLIDNGDMSALHSDHFHFYYLLRMDRWGKARNIRSKTFWDRHAGGNSFCKRRLDQPNGPKGEAQDLIESERYRVINFSSFSRHGTVEFRMLPMFDSKDVYIDAVWETLSIVHDYLSDPVLVEASGVFREYTETDDSAPMSDEEYDLIESDPIELPPVGDDGVVIHELAPIALDPVPARAILGLPQVVRRSAMAA